VLSLPFLFLPSLSADGRKEMPLWGPSFPLFFFIYFVRSARPPPFFLPRNARPAACVLPFLSFFIFSFLENGSALPFPLPFFLWRKMKDGSRWPFSSPEMRKERLLFSFPPLSFPFFLSPPGGGVREIRCSLESSGHRSPSSSPPFLRVGSASFFFSSNSSRARRSTALGPLPLFISPPISPFFLEKIVSPFFRRKKEAGPRPLPPFSPHLFPLGRRTVSLLKAKRQSFSFSFRAV